MSVFEELRTRFICQECGVTTAYDEVHTWLFCLLHKQGWSREQIVRELRRHAEFFEKGELR